MWLFDLGHKIFSLKKNGLKRKVGAGPGETTAAGRRLECLRKLPSSVPSVESQNPRQGLGTGGSCELSSARHGKGLRWQADGANAPCPLQPRSSACNMASPSCQPLQGRAHALSLPCSPPRAARAPLPCKQWQFRSKRQPGASGRPAAAVTRLSSGCCKAQRRKPQSWGHSLPCPPCAIAQGMGHFGARALGKLICIPRMQCSARRKIWGVRSLEAPQIPPCGATLRCLSRGRAALWGAGLAGGRCNWGKG